MPKVAIGLGANIPDIHRYPPRTTIERAAAELALVLDQARCSSIQQTEPQGPIPQPDYENAVVVGETRLSADELLEALQALERRHGRNRMLELRWGPRCLDLDLLLYGDDIINGSFVIVPHPRLHERRFALEPLAELEPDWVHPVLGLSIADLLEDL